jgi:hypothetical protein
MTDLINIAKECGAIDMVDLVTREYTGTKFTPDQLHATVEKVCGPLVEALQANILFYGAEENAAQAISDYIILMSKQ